MVEQQSGRMRQRPPYDNGYDPQPYAPLNPSIYAVQPPKKDGALDSNTALVFKVGQLIAFVVTVACGAVYLRDFQMSTIYYQEKVTTKMDELVKAMEGMTTARDLSEFCMSAMMENPGWKCPAGFQLQRHRQGSMHKKNVTSIQLGSNTGQSPSRY